MQITNLDQLRSIYGEPSGRAKIKTLPSLDKHAKAFIERSPFMVMATNSTDGSLDASPRGGAPGFVRIVDSNQLIFPDAKGNNRVDSLSNIVETGRVGMLFLIPGMDETLRLNGRASISTDATKLALFKEERIPPKTAIVIDIDEVFLHCAKAFMRSKLWDMEAQMDRSEMPTLGKMLNDQLGTTHPEETQEEMVKRYEKEL